MFKYEGSYSNRDLHEGPFKVSKANQTLESLFEDHGKRKMSHEDWMK